MIRCCGLCFSDGIAGGAGFQQPNKLEIKKILFVRATSSAVNTCHRRMFMVQYLSREICLCRSLQSAQFCPESAQGSQGRCLASQHPPGARSLALQGFARQTEAAGSPLARRGTLPPFPGCGHAQHLLHPPPGDQSHFLDVSKQHMLTDSAGIRDRCAAQQLCMHAWLLRQGMLALKICSSACAWLWSLQGAANHVFKHATTSQRLTKLMQNAAL